jgi:hypothetical protein
MNELEKEISNQMLQGSRPILRSEETPVIVQPKPGADGWRNTG